MGSVICIAGESGSGKTTSMRNLEPKKTMYVDCDKKGLSWKGWSKSYNVDSKNYCKTDQHGTVFAVLKKVNEDKNFAHVTTIVIDTLNALMIADEFNRMSEKGYDKWQDLAASVYYLVDYALTTRDDLNVIFICHTQTDHDDNGYLFTRVKTSGRKLDKICLESKFTTVLHSVVKDGKHLFVLHDDRSTAKIPLGCFDGMNEVENDVKKVMEELNE